MKLNVVQRDSIERIILTWNLWDFIDFQNIAWAQFKKIRKLPNLFHGNKELKFVDYLLVQADKPWFNYNLYHNPQIPNL